MIKDFHPGTTLKMDKTPKIYLKKKAKIIHREIRM